MLLQIYSHVSGWYVGLMYVIHFIYLFTGSAQVTQTKIMPNAPKALIIEPSRELAEQTLNNVTQFKKYVDNPKVR